MAILRLVFRRGTPCRLRLMAIANVFACSFVIVMTLLTTAISYYVIVPSVFSDSERSVTVHRCAIGYLFINVCGNFLLCVFVDTSTACAKKTNRRRKENVSPRTALAAKTNTPQKCNRNASGEESLKSNSINKDSLLSAAPNAPSHPPQNKNSTNSSSSYLTSSKSSVQSRSDDTSKQNQTNNISPNLDTSGAFQVSPNEASAEASSSRRSRSAHVRESSKADAPKSSTTGAPGSSSPATDQPERSHHCKLCEKQILRRDHHCFFMTVCVGFHNHKHFIFFCLYMMIGALYAVVLTAK